MKIQVGKLYMVKREFVLPGQRTLKKNDIVLITDVKYKSVLRQVGLGDGHLSMLAPCGQLLKNINFTQKDFKRLEKYQRAYAQLTEALKKSFY